MGVGVARAGLVTAAAALLLGACGGPAKQPTTTTTRPPTATVAPVPVGGPVPSGFDPLSFSAVSEDHYWVLGDAPCGTRRCPVIVRTTDGGATFVSVPSPAVAVPGDGSGTSSDPTLRFADDRDGYAFVIQTASLFSTHDGGATWRPVAVGDVLAFATGAGQVTVVTATCVATANPPCSGWALARSPVSSDAFTSAPLPFTPGAPNVDLQMHGADLWLIGAPSAVASAAHDVEARSSDAGRTFTVGDGPCGPDLGGRLAPTSGTDVW
ncbi:MAG TPA: hypothetical protein VE991_14700, partial [Acidimicrobiales bacterium]|nr:hypothetical protein [Acidimicrobiales bacterium]